MSINEIQTNVRNEITICSTCTDLPMWWTFTLKTNKNQEEVRLRMIEVDIRHLLLLNQNQPVDGHRHVFDRPVVEHTNPFDESHLPPTHCFP